MSGRIGVRSAARDLFFASKLASAMPPRPVPKCPRKLRRLSMRRPAVERGDDSMKIALKKTLARLARMRGVRSQHEEQHLAASRSEEPTQQSRRASAVEGRANHYQAWQTSRSSRRRR